MRKVPPPPTTKKTGKQVTKPPKLAPRPVKIEFMSQDQQISQSGNAQVNEANDRVDTSSIKQNTYEFKTLSNEVKAPAQQPKPIVSSEPINEENGVIAQNQKEQAQQVVDIQLSFQVLKVPIAKKIPSRPAPGVKKTLGPSIVPLKKGPTPASFLIAQQEQLAVTSQPQNITAQVSSTPQIQEKPIGYQYSITTPSQTQAKPDLIQNIQTHQLQIQNEPLEELPIKSQPMEQNQAQIQLPIVEQARKPVPPPAVKKVLGTKVPPPTKNIPKPPKINTPVLSQPSIEQPSEITHENPAPIQQINQQSQLIHQEQNSQTISPKKQNLPERVTPRKEQITQTSESVADMSKKSVVPPPIKKAPLPSPKKIQVKPPTKIAPVLPMKTEDANQEVSVSKTDQTKELSKPQIPKVPHQQKQQQAQPSQSTSQDSSTAYNELQQKLRRLEMMRSRIDQSSEQSYSNHNDDIEEQQQEADDSEHQSNTSERKAFINIMDSKDNYLNDEQQKDNYLNDDQQKDHQRQQFVIGETNYDQMEIKDYHEPQIGQKNHAKYLEGQTQPIVHNPFSNQLIELSSSHNEQDSLIPVPPDTVLDSNLSVEQAQQYYLPDQFSNSPLESHPSIHQTHPIHHHQSSNNNVAHADKYHSQANFSSIQAPNQTTDKNQLQQAKHKETQELTERQKTRDIKKAPLKDDSLIVNKNQAQTINSKNNFPKQKPQQHLIILKPARPIQSQLNHMASIEQLLNQFNSRKSQYVLNLQKLKRTEEKFKKEEMSYQERISALLQEVNHTNLLLMKYVNVPYDKMSNHDRLKEVQEL